MCCYRDLENACLQRKVLPSCDNEQKYIDGTAFITMQFIHNKIQSIKFNLTFDLMYIYDE